MAATDLDIVVNDKSSLFLTLTFTDEDGASATPKTVTYTLMDADGTIINLREDVSVTPASSMTIVLSGNDVDYDDGSKRVILFKITYDSSLENDVPFNAEYSFTINNLIGLGDE